MINPHKLPVYDQKEKILHAIQENQVVVVESPTGSGKTTQLPVILYETGYAKTGMIGVTQPRRIAAVSVCEFIAKQLDAPIPRVSGYKMRFEDRTSEETKIKIMTDGILLQELKTDRYLSKYNVIIVDEAHERSLNIDFILGLLKFIIEQRPEFRVVISSATINAEIFSEYFGGAPVVHIETVVFPVGIVYDPLRENAKSDDLIGKIVEVVSRITAEQREGDILVFLSGEKQIKDCMTLLQSMPFRKKLFLIPLYGRLSKEEQERVFIETPPNKIKVVISTNIAETSVTIDGITSVIDSGLAKINYYNPRTYTSSLIENPISKASCNQRKGRAGRTRPGTCYRLYTKKDYEQRSLFTLEEIYRTDLSEVVLRMAEIGITDFESFDFISPPGKEGIISAVETLVMLDALGKDRALSSVGEMMVRYPLLPRLARMIVEAVHRYPDVLEEVLIAVSFLSTNTPFLLPQGEEIAARKAHHSFQHQSGDFVSYVKLFHAYIKSGSRDNFCKKYYLDDRTMAEIVNIKRQMEEITSELGIPITSGGSIRNYLCAISKGLIQFVCVKSKGTTYRSLTADRIYIHPGSVMFRETPRYIVAGEIVRTSKMFARSVSPLKKEWLSEISGILSENLLSRTSGQKRSAQGVVENGTGETQVNLKIGHKFFPVSSYKGKKILVDLDWKSLSSVMSAYAPPILKEYRRYRGRIIYKNFEVLTGEKLSTILKIAENIDLEHDILTSWPKGVQYHLPKDLRELCNSTDKILKLCPSKKKGGKQLGFLNLHTDGIGTFWYTCSRGFHNALSQSLSSLETLIDSMDIDDRSVNQKEISTLYRRLSSFFDENS